MAPDFLLQTKDAGSGNNNVEADGNDDLASKELRVDVELLPESEPPPTSFVFPWHCPVSNQDYDDDDNDGIIDDDDNECEAWAIKKTTMICLKFRAEQ